MPRSPRKTPRKNKPKKLTNFGNRHGICSPPRSPHGPTPPTPRMSPVRETHRKKWTSPPRPPKIVDWNSSSPKDQRRSPSVFIFYKYYEPSGKIYVLNLSIRDWIDVNLKKNGLTKRYKVKLIALTDKTMRVIENKLKHGAMVTSSVLLIL